MSTVISVEQVSKSYRLGQIGGGTLKEDVSRWWAKLRGQPDPTLKIGQEHHARLVGEQFWALEDVSFEVKEGEVLGIIGRNGAGKSTLLKILSQVTTPTSGQIKIKGRIASLLEVGTGFHPELTGRENAFLNGAILGMTKTEIRKKFDEIVDFSGIEEFIDTPVKRYSSGMYVRLAFAVAAHLEPEILIVDEVLAVGDSEFQKKCIGKMQDVSRGGRTVLFVSHNLDAVARLCTSAILLRAGRLYASGSTLEMTNEYLRQIRCDCSLKCQPHGTKGVVASINFPTMINGEPVDLKVVCESADTCHLQELALVIETDRGQRVGLIDFRIAGNRLQLTPPEKEVFTASLEKVDLVAGRYSAKLWVYGDGIQEDIEMGEFEVVDSPHPNLLSLYRNEINGVVPFRGKVSRQTLANAGGLVEACV